MISLSHRTLFVHIPKCAGQSVELAFMQDLGLESWENHRWMLGLMEAPERWQKRGLPKRLAHCSAYDYLKHDLLPKELFDSFYKFAVVRDPVDRAVSTWRYLGSKNFDRFVDKELEKMIKKRDFFYLPQKDYLCHSETGELLVDDVIPFSELSTRWGDVKEKAGLKVDLPYRNKTETQVPKPEVTEAHREKLREIYAEDYSTLRELL